MSQDHILLLGGTGISGLAFVKHLLSLPPASQPYLTIYVRNAAKLAAAQPAVLSSAKIRTVTGSLNDASSLSSALAPGSTGVGATAFPAVTAAVSFLGAYLTLRNFVTRDTTTPIADAYASTVIPALKAHGVPRLLTLSTPGAFPLPGEYERLSYKWWFFTWILPKVVVPQGNAEMRALARATTASGLDEWTVFRVPHLTEDDPGLAVAAGELGPSFRGSWELSRHGLARWVLREISEKKWVKGAPAVGNQM